MRFIAAIFTCSRYPSCPGLGSGIIGSKTKSQNAENQAGKHRSIYGLMKSQKKTTS